MPTSRDEKVARDGGLSRLSVIFSRVSESSPENLETSIQAFSSFKAEVHELRTRTIKAATEAKSERSIQELYPLSAFTSL
jgi:hypothetical protein